MANVVFDFLADTSDLEAGQARVADGFGDGEKASKGFGLTAKVALGAVVAGAALTAAAIAKAAMAAINMSAELNVLAKNARGIGASVGEVDKLQGALDLLTRGGVDAARTMQDLQRGLAEAREGSGPTYDALQKLGLSASDLAGLPVPEAMARVAESFGGLRDSTERTQVAMDVFGRSGRALVPALVGGRKAIDAATAAIEETGVVSETAAAQSEDLQDAILLMSRTGDSLRRDVLVPLLPALIDLATFTRDALAAMRENGLSEFAAGLGDVASGAILAARALFGLDAAERQRQAASEAGQAAIQKQSERIQKIRRDLKLWTEMESQNSLALAARPKEVARLTDELEHQIKVLRRLRGELSEDIPGLLPQSGGTAPPMHPTLTGGGLTGGGLAGADDGAAKAAEDLATAIEAAAERRRAVIEELVQISTEATDSQLGDSERLITQHEREVARISALAEESASSLEVSEEERLQILTAATAARLGLEAELQAGLAELRDEAHAAVLAQMEEEKAARKATNQAILGAASSLTSSLVSLVGVIAGAVVDGTEEETEARREAAMNAWKANKAAAIAQAAINIALGVSNAFGNAPNAVVGAIMAIAAGIAGGVALAAVIATKPPQFHDGGPISDEIDIRARAGEVVLPPQTVRSLGGPDGVAQVAAGGGAQTLTVVQKLDHRVLDVQTHRAIQRTGSPLDSALRATNPRGTGRRNPYSART